MNLISPSCDLSKEVREALQANPLSFAQQQLWLIDQMQGHSTQYNLPDAFRVYGPLTVEALAGAFRDIVQRHQVLRSIIVSTPTGPVQQVVANDLQVLIEDLTGVEATSRDTLLHTILESEWSKPFTLHSEIPIRVRIIKLGHQDHLVVRTIHHLAFDGWSHEIFDHELAMFYRQRLSGELSQVAPLKTQYAEFACWDASRIDKDIWDRDLLYWRRTLHNAPYELALPRDRNRLRPQEFAGAGCLRVLSMDQFQKLKALCRSCRVTPFVALLSLYAALLSRYASQSDVIIGYPATDREQVRFKDLIGCFAKSMFARVTVDPRMNFRELVAQVNSTIMDGDLHRSVPFSVLADKLLGKRDSSVTPFYQSTFAYQPRRRQDLVLQGLKVESITMGFGVRFDLELYCWRHGDELELHWLYNTSLFDSWRIEQIADHFLTLIDSIMLEPDCPLDQIVLIDEEAAVALLSGTRQSETVSPSLIIRSSSLPDPEQPNERQTGNDYKHPESGALATRVDEALWAATGRMRLEPPKDVILYVLDSDLKFAIPGVVGDIYFSTLSTAADESDLSYEIYTLPQTLYGQPGPRLHRTGDLGRWDQKGAVELLARSAGYVWFQKMLVDFSRIEYFLHQQPGVEQAAVSAGTDFSGRPILVAYLRISETASSDFAGIVRLLRQLLPEYMVPQHCIQVPTLPLTLDGKIDRAQLYQLDPLAISSVEGFTPPETYLQEALCDIFVEILEVDMVGIHDNFFDLGGHSLLVTRLANKIKKRFGVVLPMHLLLESASPFLIAEEIDSRLDHPENREFTSIDTIAKPQLRRRQSLD
jgi:acyl carrier protein